MNQFIEQEKLSKLLDQKILELVLGLFNGVEIDQFYSNGYILSREEKPLIDRLQPTYLRKKIGNISSNGLDSLTEDTKSLYLEMLIDPNLDTGSKEYKAMVKHLSKTKLFQILLNYAYAVHQHNPRIISQDELSIIVQYLNNNPEMEQNINLEKWSNSLTNDELILYTIFEDLNRVLGKTFLDDKFDSRYDEYLAICKLSSTDANYHERVRDLLGGLPEMPQEAINDFCQKLRAKNCVVTGFGYMDIESLEIIQNASLYQLLLNHFIQELTNYEYSLANERLGVIIYASRNNYQFIEAVFDATDLSALHIEDAIQLASFLSNYPDYQIQVIEGLAQSKDLSFEYLLNLIAELKDNPHSQQYATEILLSLMTTVPEIDEDIYIDIDLFLYSAFVATNNNTQARANLLVFIEKYGLQDLVSNFGDIPRSVIPALFGASENPIDNRVAAPNRPGAVEVADEIAISTQKQ